LQPGIGTRAVVLEVTLKNRPGLAETPHLHQGGTVKKPGLRIQTPHRLEGPDGTLVVSPFKQRRAVFGGKSTPEKRGDDQKEGS
jgi:hypothetical protein